MQWETVIGLEVHVQLNTASKIFSGASTDYGAEPNTQACAVDLGLPGVLPVLNEQAVRMAVTFGLAIDAEIGAYSVFARKHYFYPDLPKGYQISQFELPIVGKGHLDIQVEGQPSKRVGVTRAHLEEDAGKSQHEGFGSNTGIDLNRAGTPLIEVVSEPEMHSAQEAVAYLRKLHALVTCLDICDGNMQEGSFRCDANVSVRPVGSEEFGTRTETKNINSFRFVEKAIEYEVERQIDVLESGGKIVQETRLFDPDRGETRSMRSKEEAHDYRYFPDPDLLPVAITDELKAELRALLPELPDARCARFVSEFGLGEDLAQALNASREMADYFESVVAATGPSGAAIAANWVTGELAGYLNREGLEISASPVSAAALAGLLARIADGSISGKIAKQVFEAMCAGEGSADEVIEAKGLRQISDSGELGKIIDDIVASHPDQVEQFRGGKEKLLGFFVGKVMQATRGQANPGEVNRLLREALK